MHDRRAGELRRAVARIGVDIRPESMGMTWEVVDQVLPDLRDFVRRAGLPVGIGHDFVVYRAFLDRLRALVDGDD